MRFSPTARLLVLVIVVASGVLGSVYAIGRTMGAGTARPSEFANPQSGETGHPPGTGSPAGTGRSSDTAPPTTAAPRPDQGYDLPPLPPEAEGAFGSRLTTGTSEVALTFDDGPDPVYTPQVLALLRAYRVKATFCMVGQNAQAHPELVRAVVADGHTLCNHSWSHDLLLGTRDPAMIQADLAATDAALQAAAPGAPVRYFRHPGGNWTPVAVETARSLGMTSLHWAVDPRDWTRPGAEVVYGRVLVNTAPGSIVLLHDGGGDRQGTVTALGAMLPKLLGRFRLGALPTERSAVAYPATGQPAAAAEAEAPPRAGRGAGSPL